MLKIFNFSFHFLKKQTFYLCNHPMQSTIIQSVWDGIKQILEEVSFTDGKIYVRGKLTARGALKEALEQ
jgi:hypothetical protein